MPPPSDGTRREILAAGAAFAAILLSRPARATPEEMDAALRGLAGEAQVRQGKVKIEVPPLVENGNSVPLTVTIDTPVNATEYVRAIAVFNEKNPQPNVAQFRLGPRAGRAVVSTRLRLTTTQKLTAVAELSDGTFWSGSAEVIVTLAACTEEG